MTKMRLRFAIFGTLLLSATAAQARPDARTMTCEAVRALIDERGAAVITTGRHTYKRFVAHRGFCLYFERIGHDWIATADTAQCRLRVCVDPVRFKRPGSR